MERTVPVYRKKNAATGKLRRTFSYDFQVGGRRFSGDTGETDARNALRIERKLKEEAKTEFRKGTHLIAASWSFNEALVTYFNEKLKSQFDSSTKSVFVWLQREVGDDTRLTSITTQFIARLIAKKTKEKGNNGTVSDSTVNRTVTEPLRRILRYAADVHEQPVAKINWKALIRAEPKERVRELSSVEETALFNALRSDYHPIVHFCLISGLRLSEAVNLRWQDIDFGTKKVWITGKGNKRAPIPLAPALSDVISDLRTDNDDFVFTYVAERTTTNPRDGILREKGKRYPISYYGLKTTFKRALLEAGLKDFRFHDLRHTAASRILRGSGNIKLVQTILRHEDITTTMRYAHVQDRDVMMAMEAGANRAVQTDGQITTNNLTDLAQS